MYSMETADVYMLNVAIVANDAAMIRDGDTVMAFSI